MNSDAPSPGPQLSAGLPQRVPPPRWLVYRRAVYLAALMTGLVLLFTLLTTQAREALFHSFHARRALIGMMLLFTGIALSLLWAAGQRMDARVFMLFNVRGYRRKWLDQCMWMATHLGSFVTASVLAMVLFASNYRRMATETILGTLSLWLVVESIKAVTDRVRPFHALEGAVVVGSHEPGRSFPSGHTAQTFFLAVLMAHRFQLAIPVILALYLVAALVGFTRLYVGAHYPRDVLGGALLGSVWGSLAAVVDPFWFQHWTR